MCSQIPAKAQKAYDKAQAFLLKLDTAKAIKQFDQAITWHRPFAASYIELYKIYVAKNNSSLALENVEQATEYASAKVRPNLLFNAGKLALTMGNYEKARKFLISYLALNTKDETTRELAKLFLDQSDYGILHPVTTGRKKMIPLYHVNTPLPEYLPSLDALGNRLVFTRRNKGNEDLFIATKSSVDSMWNQIDPWPLNTGQNEGAHTISANGKTILFTKCNCSDCLGSCDLFISEFTDGIWSKPKNMGANINTSEWESQPSLSSNGQVLFFASNRMGGKGGSDIYKSIKLNNQWSKPMNLGDSINTKWDENSPFIHVDGTTLYFRSNGWPGYGSFDLYNSYAGSKGWSKALNLGGDLNDYNDQGSMIVAIDGKTMYYTEQRINLKSELVESNIVTALLNEAQSAQPCVYIRGKAINAKTGDKMVSVPIFFSNTESDALKDSIFTDQDGEYLLILPSNKTYMVNSFVRGFGLFSERVISNESHTLKFDILFYPIDNSIYADTSKSIILKNVLFQSGSAMLEKESFSELDILANYLYSQPGMQAEIMGHTDTMGNSKDNLKLSEERAKTVLEYLVSRGVDRKTLTSKGYGDTKPIATNQTNEGKQANRRVEIKLKSN